MAWEVILWVIFFIMNTALIASNLYQIVCLTDLEADYMNPYDSSSRINAVIIPEMVLHGVCCALFLVTGHWFMFLLTLPIAIYSTMLYSKKRHLIDVTEVFRFIDAEKKYRIAKLAFYLILFVLVIIRMVIAIVNNLIDDEEERVPGFGIF
ncbi:protein cornichon homolog 1-like [Cynara cardunculus var. scolymus]|uniref:Cornichon n=1 Tax=Cynara cardunculus var. scolymus TaxID=59895 RepID=A0A103YMW6_CYNCS|nr:protein cornichon homolog 1-like [Cynara cardunculus var. scolymus]KVI12054.1 Cornichon [Cynara cardunculus var. scolymus]